MIETTSRLSSKRQITLPARMARALGLAPGSEIILRLEDDRIVLLPAPDSYTQSLGGSLKGAYGRDVEQYIREERASLGVLVTDWATRLSTLHRVALDTNAVIYFLDRTEPYFALIERVFERAENGLIEIVIPSFVETELLVAPIRDGNETALEAIRLLLDHFPGLTVAPADRAAAQAAARLRARHGIATPDALIAGSALAAGCDALIGNDRLCASRLTSQEYVALFAYVEAGA